MDASLVISGVLVGGGVVNVAIVVPSPLPKDTTLSKNYVCAAALKDWVCFLILILSAFGDDRTSACTRALVHYTNTTRTVDSEFEK